MKKLLLAACLSGFTAVTAVAGSPSPANTSAVTAVAGSPGDTPATFSYFKYTGDDARFRQAVDTQTQYLNPILAGFYPDPSICRVGDTFYLVNSSFSFYPGVPIFTSTDLVHWTQLGHVLDRPDQLPLQKQGVSGGIFAPDIKYNPKNKTFYMITTNVGMGNFYVKTQDPAKGWSNPVVLPQIDGIDPSFFFDKDGSAYIVHNGPVEGGADYEGQRAIRILKFDVKGDSVITRDTPDQRGWKQIVRGGTHVDQKPIWIEGPHLYRIGKYYYLMCAEGGTGDWHSEVIFRAPLKSDITDAASWEECPNNPILTQRYLYDYVNGGTSALPDDVVTSTGHADLVEDQHGQWWAVFLGCRPYEGPFYNTGRDTYLLPVSWKGGWPTILPRDQKLPTVVNAQLPKPKAKARISSKNKVSASSVAKARAASSSGVQYAATVSQPTLPTTGNFTYTDRFDTPQLSQRWMFLRNPDLSRYTTGHGLTIRPLPVNISQRESLSAVFCRQQHNCFEAETELTFTPTAANELAGMALLQNEDYNFVLGKTLLDGRPAVVLTRAEKQRTIVASAFLADSTQPLSLRIVGNGRYYSFYYHQGDGQWLTLATGVDAINLSTSRSGGFIGACIGLYATTAN